MEAFPQNAYVDNPVTDADQAFRSGFPDRKIRRNCALVPETNCAALRSVEDSAQFVLADRREQYLPTLAN